MIAVSACLLGYNYKYDGKNNLHSGFFQLLKNYKILPICPEVAGGLPIPRPPAEIKAGDGFDVLAGKAEVVNNKGLVVTDRYIEGAKKCLNKFKKNNISFVILKSKSPACGVRQIYDGRFKSNLKKGKGVATALFIKYGYKVYSEKDYETLKELLH